MPILSRPNILLILCRGLNAADAAGLRAVAALAKAGRSFDCDLPDPRSAPIRATVMTGRWPQSHGLWADGAVLPAREELLPQQLAAAGYDCGLVGANHLAPVGGWRSEARRDDDGYSHWHWAHGPTHRARQNAYIAWLKTHHITIHDRLFPSFGNPDEAAPDPALVQALATVPEAAGFNQWVAETAIKVMDQPRDASQPWFLVAGFQALDGADALARVDAGIARLVAGVGDLGDTLIILTADAAAKDGRSAADLRVPLVLHWPRHLPDGPVTAASPVDIAPTICAAAGLSARPRHQGRSLLVAQTHTADRITTFREGTRGALTMGTSAFVLYDYRLVLDHTPSRPTTALYHLTTDPDERRNLADDPAQAGRIEAMTDHLLAALIAREDRSQPLLGAF
jgi:arylsulfatase